MTTASNSSEVFLRASRKCILVLLCFLGTSSAFAQPPEKNSRSAGNPADIGLKAGEPIVCIGDSLTAGTGAKPETYPHFLAQLSGATVLNIGVGGQSTTQIAARAGSIPILVTVADGRIPAAGDAPIESMSVSPISHGAPPRMEGHLGGVQGSLTTDSKGTYHFVRKAPGQNVTLKSPVNFILTDPLYRSPLIIVWAGRNNASNPGEVLGDIESMTSGFTKAHKKFLVLSILNGEKEGRNTITYHNISIINSSLKFRYETNFLDVRKILIAHYDKQNADDKKDFLADIPPRSLRSDDLHLNAAGYRLIAQSVYDTLRSNR